MGYRISKVYTGTGDQGSTGLASGERVAKSHPRIEAIGALDELNSQLGMLLALLAQAANNTELARLGSYLQPLQHLLFDFGGELALPAYQVITAQHTHQLEQKIDNWSAKLPALKDFILPSGSVLIAQAHLCRCNARNAERRCQLLSQQEELRPELLAFLNRLSDLFFVAARVIAAAEGKQEILWQAQPAN